MEVAQASIRWPAATTLMRLGTRAAAATMDSAIGTAMTDAELIVRSWDDPAVFAEIFDRHHEAIYRFVWSRVGQRAADDVAAEVFRVAFERRHDYDPDYRSAKPWLFGIGSNLTKQYHRRTKQRTESAERAATANRHRGPTDPEEQIAQAVTDPEISEALETVPERDREPLLLYAWGDLTYDEIADSLAIPIGTVRSRIHRARTQLREQLESDDGAHSSSGGSRHE